MAPAFGPRQSGASGGFCELSGELFQPRTTPLPSPMHSLWADSRLLWPRRHLRAPRAPRRRRWPDAHMHRRHRRHRRRHLRPLRRPSRRLERGAPNLRKIEPARALGLWCGRCRSPLAPHWLPRRPSPSHASSTTYPHRSDHARRCGSRRSAAAVRRRHGSRAPPVVGWRPLEAPLAASRPPQPPPRTRPGVWGPVDAAHALAPHRWAVRRPCARVVCAIHVAVTGARTRAARLAPFGAP